MLGEPPRPTPSLSLLATTWVSATELQVKVTAPAATALRTDTVDRREPRRRDGGDAPVPDRPRPGPRSSPRRRTRAGSVVATFTPPAGAPAGETYDLRVCATCTLTIGLPDRARGRERRRRSRAHPGHVVLGAAHRPGGRPASTPRCPRWSGPRRATEPARRARSCAASRRRPARRRGGGRPSWLRTRPRAPGLRGDGLSEPRDDHRAA